MIGGEEVWYDADAGPLVRLYARVGGRTPRLPDGDALELNAIVSCAADTPSADLSAEQRTVLRLARRPLALSEVAVYLGMPIGPTRLLLGELRDAGLIDVRRPPATDRGESPAVLQRLLTGLQAL